MAVAQKRDAVRTRARLVAVAMTEFSAKGFDGARVEAIARHSNVTKQMIYHYFGSKEGLYLSVLAEMYETLRANQQELSLTDLPPVEALRALMEHTFDVVLRNPEFVGLLNGENLLRAAYIKRIPEIKKLYRPLIKVIKEILDRGVADGSYRSGIDAVELYICMGSLSFHAISNQHTLRTLFDIDLMSPKVVRRRREQVADMIIAYCRPQTPHRPTHRPEPSKAVAEGKRLKHCLVDRSSG